MIHNSFTFAFFGTDEFSVIILDELKKDGFVPALIVTATDKKMGRGMRLTPPPVKLWAQKNNIQFLQTGKLDGEFYFQLSTFNFQLFVVASYGKIIPKRILDIPAHGALNVHPSLLPLYRGPSPLESQILGGVEETGVTIMLMDEQMDHGPIVAQRKINEALWETRGKDGPCAARPVLPLRVFHNAKTAEIHDALAHLGGQLLAEIIPQWLAGKIAPREQEHDKATYTKKITKEDGLIDLTDGAEKKYRKFLAYSSWPSVYFFVERGNKKLRVKITDAELVDDKFVIKKVIPEGKREVHYEDFIRSLPEPTADTPKMPV